MKKLISSFTILALSFYLNIVQAQTIYTYSGVYNHEKSYLEGRANYQYVIIDGKKVKHGSFSFSSSNITEIGSYYYGKKNGLWTCRQNYLTLGNEYNVVKKQDLNYNYITEIHNYCEVSEVSNINYSKGKAHGFYNENVTTTQKWWYSKPGSKISIKKRNGEYKNNKRVSQTGSFTKNGIKIFYFNANYINDSLNGLITFQNRDLKTVFYTKKGKILKYETTNFTTGKVEKEYFKIDSSFYFRLNSTKKGYFLNNGNIKLEIDSFPNTTQLRYNFISKQTHEYKITADFENLRSKFLDTFATAYYEKYSIESLSPFKLNLTNNFEFKNLDEEYEVMNLYFKLRKNLLNTYNLELLILDYDAYKKLSEEDKLKAQLYDTTNIKRDTIWQTISEYALRNMVANGDLVGFMSMKNYPTSKYYDSFFYILMWGFLKKIPDIENKKYQNIVSSKNWETEKAIEDARILLSFFKTKKHFPILDSFENSLSKIEERRFKINDNNLIINDSVSDFGFQYWSYRPIQMHLSNKKAFDNWWDEYYYTLSPEVLKLCPADLNIPTIEDIEYNYQDQKPLQEALQFNKETYISDDEIFDPKAIAHGTVMIVRDFNTNELNFYSLNEKKIIKEGISAAKVRCVKNK